MWCTVLIVTDAQGGFAQVRKVFKCKERAQSSYESQRRCAFLSNKGKEGLGGRKGSVSVGIALGHHTLSARERERERERQKSRGASCHPSISTLLVLFISPFFCFFPLHLFTQIVSPSTFPAFQLMHCSMWTHVIVVETRERGRWGLQTPNLSLCLQAVKVVAVTFHLLYKQQYSLRF